MLQELKRSGADKIIIEQVNNGKVYIGESSGSVIVSPNIEYIAKMDSKDKAQSLVNYDGLALVDFCVVPHCSNFPFKKSAEKIINMYSNTLVLEPINNNQAIYVIDNKKEIKTI